MSGEKVLFTVVFSLDHFSSWTFFLGVRLQTDIYHLNLISVFTVKFNPKFKPFTQKIQITKAGNFEKIAGDEAFLMTSLAY